MEINFKLVGGVRTHTAGAQVWEGAAELFRKLFTGPQRKKGVSLMTGSIQKGGLKMERMITIRASLLALILTVFVPGVAQSQMGGQMQMGGQAGQQEQSPSQQPMMGMMCPMMSGGMMSMMPGMMGGRMGRSGMGMMGMMGGDQTDPKTMGRMLQLRGDILKAIGEVMLKHGKAMEEAK